MILSVRDLMNTMIDVLRLVPKLIPQEVCEDVPKEVCFTTLQVAKQV